MSTPRRILIVGGGPAGTFAAIAARKQDPAAVVTLLSDEPHEPYEKPPLSKAVLLGKKAAADHPIAGPGGIAAHGVALVGGCICTAVDRDAKAVVLADGRRLPYDALVLATGASNRELSALPFGMPGVHYLRVEADAARLKADLAPGKSLLVVGGGLIGLEVAASASELGVRTTVVEALPRILSRVCDDATGAVVHDAHREHGVDIWVSTRLNNVSRQPDGRIAAAFDSEDVLIVDLVVIGIGARPNDALAASCGLATDDGIVVDERCRTSDPSIYAAGDVVRFPGPHGPVRLENWRHAQDQGAVAGRNAAGASDAYDSVPSFWSEQYDLYIQGVGWQVDGARRVRRPLGERRALMFEIADGRLMYAMGISAQKDLMAARRLIERKTPVDAASLADPSTALMSLLKK